MPAARASSVDISTPLSSPEAADRTTRNRSDSLNSSVGGGGAVGSGPLASPTPTSSKPTGRVRIACSSRRKYLPTYKIVLLGDSAVGKSNLLNRFAKGHFNELSRATIGVEFVSREVDLGCAAPSLAGNFHDVDALVAAAVTPSNTEATHSGYHSPELACTSPMNQSGSPPGESPPPPSASQRHASGPVSPVHPRALSGELSLSGGPTAPFPTTTTTAAPGSGAASSVNGPGPSPRQPQANPLSDRVMLQLWDTAGQEANAALSAVYYRGARGVAVVYDVTRRETLYNVGRWVASARRHCDDACVICVIGNKTDLRHSVAVPEEEARDFCHSLGCRHYLASAMNGEGVEHAFLQLLLAVHAEATVRGVANELPNGVDVVRRVGGSRGTLTAVDNGDTIAGFRLSGAKPKKRGPCCGKS